MNKVILILFINVLFVPGCDFADHKLTMYNDSSEVIIVETTYFKDNMSQGIPQMIEIATEKNILMGRDIDRKKISMPAIELTEEDIANQKKLHNNG